MGNAHPRYMLFAGAVDYPRGGMRDWCGSTETVVDAVKLIPRSCDWFHIYDIKTGETHDCYGIGHIDDWAEDMDDKNG